ncbi:MAG: Gfo/Idh/MocA family oxidoreductase [Ferruginibacter sp.]|nr:Gfo/Idh/MocA family oxidoreductase [Cytophagales bacterium]
MNRRDFLAQTSAASLAYSAAPLLGALGRTTPYRTALVGSGWWGMNILRCAVQAGESKVVALCDVDRNQLRTAAEELTKLSSDRPKPYGDYRELLAREKPEIVIVATPDHWHPLITIAAVAAGAHVYVEKPIGHTIREGRAMVNAARRHNRVVQVGTHRRVSPHNVSGREFLRSGKAGQIGMVRAFVHYGGGAGKPVPDAEPPAGLDWNMWCGPAPLRAYNPALHPRGFRSFLDYANGQLGDWGIHWMDQILWCTEEKYPRKVFSTGGRHIRRDHTDAPDTQVASFEFESFTVSWEHRQFAANNAEKGENVGCYFYGTEGTFHMGWQDGWTFYPADNSRPVLHEAPKLNQPDDQNIRELWADFLKAIAEGRRPVCDIEVGHRSTTVSLLGMLSYKLGRSVAWNGEKEEILNDPEANQLLSRLYRAPWEYPKG